MELKNVMQVCDIGLQDYPIFDESHRNILNKKLIDHYYMREIGVESVDSFVFMLNRTMREIMPEFNQLYKSELLNFNPLLTVDMKTISDSLNTNESNTTTTGTSNTDSSSQQDTSQTGDTTSDSKSRAVNSTTPQQRLAGNMDYASSGADSTSNSSTENTTTGSDTASSTVDATNNVAANSDDTNTGHGESTTQGYQGSASRLLLDFRETILNIDMLIVEHEKIEELFMQIWLNGDQYTNNYHLGAFRHGYGTII